ncbi:hypothetical protein TNCV_2301581 [Trichonephila clavipes]|nr:hypothetical protein TNCV_2301581 [Trichonephila clavipes]
MKDAELGTIQVSHQLVEMPDIEHSVDTELATTLVFQQLCELAASRSACSSLRNSDCGNVSLSLATFIARALLELWKRLDLSFHSIILSRIHSVLDPFHGSFLMISLKDVNYYSPKIQIEIIDLQHHTTLISKCCPVPFDPRTVERLNGSSGHMISNEFLIPYFQYCGLTLQNGLAMVEFK